MKPTSILSVAVSVFGLPLFAASAWAPGEWPVLKTYAGESVRRIALPLGGIGTGTVSLGGRGELTSWQIFNVPADGFVPCAYGNDAPSFVLYAKDAAGAKTLRLLEGPARDEEILNGEGRPSCHLAFVRFESAEFAAAYPFGQVRLAERGLPVRVTVKGFNPFVPGDSAASSLPVAVLSYEVENLTDAPLEAAVCGHLRNFIGVNASEMKTDWTGLPNRYHGMCSNRNDRCEGGGLVGIRLRSEGVDRSAAGWGTFAFATADDPAAHVTTRTDFTHADWYSPTVELADDFGADGSLDLASVDQRDSRDPMAALAVRKTIPARGKAAYTFYFTWSFPNRRDWDGRTTVGNHYATLYPEAWRAMESIVPRLPALERRTVAFVESFLSSSAPEELKEAALFNLAVLRSPTVFRLPSGHLMGWEGVFDFAGSCYGNCTHVWNYEQATAYLFGDLARTMRDVEFNYATDADGRMAYRSNLPLADATRKGETAADGQMGTILKAYREWILSGDRAFLDSIWPRVKKALAYAWTAKDDAWDPDGDGVMEGPQGNTMDVRYWGPNPQMAFWYLGALKAGAAMARVEGDADFAAECEAKAAAGAKKFDALAFNGEYYEQKIPTEKAEEPYQLGRGCLVDQLVGQTFARQLGLGLLGDPAHLRSAIESVARYNYTPDFGRVFNPLRAYGLAGEAGLVMSSWPRGFQPRPFPYYSEVMTGFEYVAASELYAWGLDDLALRTVRDVRARHNGARRNPFREPECGHHYARSMASWGTYLAWSGFGYDATTGEMRFANRPGRHFWSVGSAWGTADVAADKVAVRTVEGALPRLERVLVAGRSVRHEIADASGQRR